VNGTITKRPSRQTQQLGRKNMDNDYMIKL
jgi:hypothetical protein